ncbi:hypothetical protein RRG08_025858 [Elysia crispata]|uniref:Uncharacterized protein n=1 Tax=Elysia crispata TaxID=231223 RepID=A0AAE0Y311_9GAST|nr:hypothetical protein RRG08_025858 [Elysia crispata]
MPEIKTEKTREVERKQDERDIKNYNRKTGRTGLEKSQVSVDRERSPTAKKRICYVNQPPENRGILHQLDVPRTYKDGAVKITPPTRPNRAVRTHPEMIRADSVEETLPREHRIMYSKKNKKVSNFRENLSTLTNSMIHNCCQQFKTKVSCSNEAKVLMICTPSQFHLEPVMIFSAEPGPERLIPTALSLASVSPTFEAVSLPISVFIPHFRALLHQSAMTDVNFDLEEIFL